jgi:hypothetical protein
MKKVITAAKGALGRSSKSSKGSGSRKSSSASTGPQSDPPSTSAPLKIPEAAQAPPPSVAPQLSPHTSSTEAKPSALQPTPSSSEGDHITEKPKERPSSQTSGLMYSVALLIFRLPDWTFKVIEIVIRTRRSH